MMGLKGLFAKVSNFPSSLLESGFLGLGHVEKVNHDNMENGYRNKLGLGKDSSRYGQDTQTDFC